MPAVHASEADLADSEQFREAGSKSVFAEHDAGGFVYDLNRSGCINRCRAPFGPPGLAAGGFLFRAGAHRSWR